MSVKLFINLSCLVYPLTGIGCYTKNIAKECLKRNINLVGIKNGVLLDSVQIESLLSSLDEYGIENDEGGAKDKLKSFIRSLPGSYSFRHFILSFRSKNIMKRLAREGFIYFEPNFIALPYAGKTIVTIHDLSFLAFPEYHPAERVRFLQEKVKENIALATHVVVDSHFIKQELLSAYDVKEAKVSTVYLGVDSDFNSSYKALGEGGLGGFDFGSNRFILSVATLEPRKNLTALVAAFRLLSECHQKGYPLVLVGDKGWKNSQLFESIKDLIKSKRVIITGYVSDLQLKELYANATVFVYPSFYEGFGLPVIEAMASGTPVITSDRGATKEIAGDAAILVNPYSTASIAEGITSVLLDVELQCSLAIKSQRRAEQFKWEACVDKLLALCD